MQKTWIHEKADKNYSGGNFFCQFMSCAPRLWQSSECLRCREKRSSIGSRQMLWQPSHKNQIATNPTSKTFLSFFFLYLTNRHAVVLLPRVSFHQTHFQLCSLTAWRLLSVHSLKTSMKNLQRMVTASFVDSICQILCLWKSNLG